MFWPCPLADGVTNNNGAVLNGPTGEAGGVYPSGYATGSGAVTLAQTSTPYSPQPPSGSTISTVTYNPDVNFTLFYSQARPPPGLSVLL